MERNAMTNPVRPVDFSDDSVHCQIVVQGGLASTFERFRHDIVRWWPHEFTWSADSLEDLTFEGRKGGALWERGPEGFRCDMARVLRWVPPEKMVLRWHIGPGNVPEPNPARASEVEILFFATDAGTRIDLEHRGFFRHGKGGVEYRHLMAARWPAILQAFSEFMIPVAPATRTRPDPQELANDPVLKNLFGPV
jgi:uncharacterized protein YndB with AHSA1/START domain